METLLPMRGLARYGRRTKNTKAIQAAAKASEVFLSRRLFERRSDQSVIAKGFVELHYPLYWHYDVLGGLRAMAELGKPDDPRCADALDLLESRELALRGWAADARYFKPGGAPRPDVDWVDWGPASKKRRNEWVTADALAS